MRKSFKRVYSNKLAINEEIWHPKNGWYKSKCECCTEQITYSFTTKTGGVHHIQYPFPLQRRLVYVPTYCEDCLKENPKLKDIYKVSFTHTARILIRDFRKHNRELSWDFLTIPRELVELKAKEILTRIKIKEHVQKTKSSKNKGSN